MTRKLKGAALVADPDSLPSGRQYDGIQLFARPRAASCCSRRPWLRAPSGRCRRGASPRAGPVEAAEHRSDHGVGGVDPDGPDEIPPLADVGHLVGHDLAQQRPHAVPRLGLVAHDVVEHGVDVEIERQAHELADEGRRIHEDAREPREDGVHPPHPVARRDPHDPVEMEGPEHLVEEPDVAEFLAEVVPADALGRPGRQGDRGRGVPGAGDAGPLVAGELVQERQQERLPVEGRRIVLQLHVVAVEPLRVRAGAGANGPVWPGRRPGSPPCGSGPSRFRGFRRPGARVKAQ